MKCEELFTSLECISSFILIYYQKLSHLELLNKKNSLEYEQCLKELEKMLVMESKYYDEFKNNITLINEFLLYMKKVYGEKKFSSYDKSYFLLFHEFDQPDLIAMRIFNQVKLIASSSLILESGEEELNEYFNYLCERQHKLFLDIIEDTINDKDYSSYKNMLISAKYDSAFVLRKNEVNEDLDEYEVNSISIGKYIEDLEELGLKISKLDEEKVEKNVRSVILNICYLKSIIIQSQSILIEDMIQKFNEYLRDGKINNTFGYQIFMNILNSKCNLTEYYLTDDYSLKRKY